jgi:hypothetical protein
MRLSSQTASNSTASLGGGAQKKLDLFYAQKIFDGLTDLQTARGAPLPSPPGVSHRPAVMMKANNAQRSASITEIYATALRPLDSRPADAGGSRLASSAWRLTGAGRSVVSD